MSKIIRLPHRFTPRPYQINRYKEHFINKKRYMVEVIHRRAGKTLNNLNFIIAATQERVGNYWYLMPTFTMCKNIIWEGIDEGGVRYLDYIPKSLIHGKINNSELFIRFTNGSTLKLMGTENYNALMSGNPIGIIADEYSLMSPIVWDYLRPILTRNKGWVIFTFTPRGFNHAYDLFNINKDNPDWFVRNLTVNDTYDNDGKPIYTPEDIESDRRSGMSDEMIQQEYYGSFTASMPGAYFSKEITKCEKADRISDFEIDRRYPIHTFWDIGTSDYTAIWYVQFCPNDSFKFISYYENHNQDLPHYIQVINDFRDKYGIVYQKHWGPHDIQKREFTSANTIKSTARDLGLRFETVPRIAHKKDAIELAKLVFHKIHFHKNNCKLGIEALKNYHAKYDDKKKIYSDKPVHDWSSHGSDSFMQFAQAYKLANRNFANHIKYGAVGAFLM